MELKHINGIITDWAGTAVDFGSMAPSIVLLELFADYQINITIELARSFMGMEKKTHVKSILFSDEVSAQWQSIYGKQPNLEDLENIFGKMNQKLIEILPNHADIIPGVFEFMQCMKDNNIPVGTTTGYVKEMMDVLIPAAKANGFSPDSIVCPTDVNNIGRPAPFMVFENQKRLNMYPGHKMIKLGDTIADIQEGYNAGMWIVGFTVSGNENGLRLQEWELLSKTEQDIKRNTAATKFLENGAHFVCEGMWDCLPIIERIDTLIAGGIFPNEYLPNF
jgi:phosphonoacetaldehyde hydrolase